MNPPICPQHGPRRLAVDLARVERGLVCLRHQHLLPCHPEQLRLPGTPSIHQHQSDHNVEQHGNPERGDTPANWSRRGPPTQHPGDTNSWLYVPLLGAHHGRNLGHTPGRRQWLERRVTTTAPRAAPIPWQHLHHVLTSLQHITRAAGQHLAAPEANLRARLQRHGNQLPNNTLIHLALAADLFMQPSCYIPASA